MTQTSRARRACQAAGLNPAALTPVEGGHSAAIWRADDLDGVPTAAAKLIDRGAARARAEAAALRAAAHLRVPRLLHADFTEPAVLILSWLHPNALPADAWLPGASPTRRADFARDLGAWLRELHDTPVLTDDVKLSSDPLPLHERLLSQLGRARRKLSRRAGSHPLAAPDLDLVTRAFALLQADLEPALSGAPRRLIHRDLRPANVIVGDDSFIGVVDFERAAAGPPAWDWVKLDWWLTDLHPDLSAPLRQGYGAPPDPDLVRALMVYEAASLLATFSGKHPVYPEHARAQLDALLARAPRPAWGAHV